MHPLPPAHLGSHHARAQLRCTLGRSGFSEVSTYVADHLKGAHLLALTRATLAQMATRVPAFKPLAASPSRQVFSSVSVVLHQVYRLLRCH